MDDDDAHHYHQHHFTFPVDIHHFLKTSSPFHLPPPNFHPQQPYPDLYINQYNVIDAPPPPPPPPPPTLLAPLQYLHGQQQAQNHHQQHQYDFDVNMGRHVTDILHQGSEMGMDLGLQETLDTAGSGAVTVNNNVAAATASSGGGGSGNFGGFDPDGGGGGYGGGATSSSAHVDGADGGRSNSGRWPREETLTLLEIRSRLDYKFKEANQKGPLWEEVSSIMLNEHGYKRSAKKCREKFENLYKYFKKTKEGKARRQDGKSYRFFRQFEALHGVVAGDQPPTVNKGRHATNACNISTAVLATGSGSHMIINDDDNHHHGLGRFHHISAASGTSQYDHQLQVIGRLSTDSLSGSSDFDTHSSDDDDPGGSVDGDGPATGRRRRNKKKKEEEAKSGRGSWKAMMKQFIDTQMRRLAEKQEALMDKMMRTLEHKEQERMKREEQWRKLEAERAEREQRFWANELTRMESRDAALMSALEKLMGASPSDQRRQRNGEDENGGRWPQPEIARLIQIKKRILEYSLFEEGGGSSGDAGLWEDVASKMAESGYHRTATMCKQKWDAISRRSTTRKDMEHSTVWNINKKRKDSSRKIDQNDDDEIDLYNEDGKRRIEDGTEAAVMACQGATPCRDHDHIHGDRNCVGDCCFRSLTNEGENVWE